MRDEEVVISLARDMSDAWAVSDVDRLDRHLGPEYLHVDIHGSKFDRSGFLKDAAEPRSVGRLHFDDEGVTILGDVAVLISRLAFSDFPTAWVIRILQVWVRVDDGWKRQWYQATTENAPSAP